MFKDKYPLIYEISQLIKNNELKAIIYLKHIMNIEYVTSNSSNTVMIHDYDITSKISHYKLNTEVPIITNSNTFTYQSGYASYMYYIIINMIHAMNYGQVYSEGEFYINWNSMLEIFVEVHNLLMNMYHYNNMDDPINIVKDILDELIKGNIDDEEYKYVLEDYFDNQLIVTTNENVEEIIDSFRNYYKSNNNNTGSDRLEFIEEDMSNTENISHTEIEEKETESDLLPLIEKIESTISMNEILEHKLDMENEETEYDDIPKLELDIKENKDILVSAN